MLSNKDQSEYINRSHHWKDATITTSKGTANMISIKVQQWWSRWRRNKDDCSHDATVT